MSTNNKPQIQSPPSRVQHEIEVADRALRRGDIDEHVHRRLVADIMEEDKRRADQHTDR